MFMDHHTTFNVVNNVHKFSNENSFVNNDNYYYNNILEKGGSRNDSNFLVINHSKGNGNDGIANFNNSIDSNKIDLNKINYLDSSPFKLRLLNGSNGKPFVKQQKNLTTTNNNNAENENNKLCTSDSNYLLLRGTGKNYSHNFSNTPPLAETNNLKHESKFDSINTNIETTRQNNRNNCKGLLNVYCSSDNEDEIEEVTYIPITVLPRQKDSGDCKNNPQNNLPPHNTPKTTVSNFYERQNYNKHSVNNISNNSYISPGGKVIGIVEPMPHIINNNTKKSYSSPYSKTENFEQNQIFSRNSDKSQQIKPNVNGKVNKNLADTKRCFYNSTHIINDIKDESLNNTNTNTTNNSIKLNKNMNGFTRSVEDDRYFKSNSKGFTCSTNTPPPPRRRMSISATGPSNTKCNFNNISCSKFPETLDDLLAFRQMGHYRYTSNSNPNIQQPQQTLLQNSKYNPYNSNNINNIVNHSMSDGEDKHVGQEYITIPVHYIDTSSQFPKILTQPLKKTFHRFLGNLKEMGNDFINNTTTSNSGKIINVGGGSLNHFFKKNNNNNISLTTTNSSAASPLTQIGGPTSMNMNNSNKLSGEDFTALIAKIRSLCQPEDNFATVNGNHTTKNVFGLEPKMNVVMNGCWPVMNNAPLLQKYCKEDTNNSNNILLSRIPVNGTNYDYKDTFGFNDEMLISNSHGDDHHHASRLKKQMMDMNTPSPPLSVSDRIKKFETRLGSLSNNNANHNNNKSSFVFSVPTSPVNPEHNFLKLPSIDSKTNNGYNCYSLDKRRVVQKSPMPIKLGLKRSASFLTQHLNKNDDKVIITPPNFSPSENVKTEKNEMNSILKHNFSKPIVNAKTKELKGILKNNADTCVKNPYNASLLLSKSHSNSVNALNASEFYDADSFKNQNSLGSTFFSSPRNPRFRNFNTNSNNWSHRDLNDSPLLYKQHIVIPANSHISIPDNQPYYYKQPIINTSNWANQNHYKANNLETVRSENDAYQDISMINNDIYYPISTNDNNQNAKDTGTAYTLKPERFGNNKTFGSNAPINESVVTSTADKLEQGGKVGPKKLGKSVRFSNFVSQQYIPVTTVSPSSPTESNMPLSPKIGVRQPYSRSQSQNGSTVETKKDLLDTSIIDNLIIIPRPKLSAYLNAARLQQNNIITTNGVKDDKTTRLLNHSTSSNPSNYYSNHNQLNHNGETKNVCTASFNNITCNYINNNCNDKDQNGKDNTPRHETQKFNFTLQTPLNNQHEIDPKMINNNVLTIDSVNGENNHNGQSNAFDEIDFQQHSSRIPSNSTDYQTYDQEGKNSHNYEDHVTSSDQDTVTSSIVSGALYCGKATKYSLNHNNNGILATPHNSNTNNNNNTNQQTSSTAPVNTTNNNRSTSVPRNKAGTGVLSRAISTRVVGTTGIHHGPQTPFSASHMKLNSPAPSSAGAMDEESFYESFEDVPKLHINSIVELEDTFNRMREELSTDKTDWNKRNENMRKIRSIVLCSNLTKHKEYAECMANNLKALEPAFMLALRDLRSQIVREVCITIGFLSQTFGMRWEHGAENLFAQLIILIGNTVKIMSTSAVVAIKFIIKHIHSPKLIPILANSLVTSKSREIRRNICEIFDLILHTWDTSVLEKQVTLLQDGIKRGLQDADAEARASSRKAYWGFADHFKDHAEVLIQSLDSGKQRMLRGEISNSSSNNSLYRSQKHVPSSASGLSTIRGSAKSTVKKFQNMSLEDIARGASKQHINKLRANQNFITEDKTLQSKNGSAFFFNLDAGDSNSIDGVDNNAIVNGKESKTSLHLSSMNKNDDLSMPTKQSHSNNHQQVQNNGGVATNSNVMLLNNKLRSTSAIDALAAARAKARKNYALISANNAYVNNNTANVNLNSYNSSTTGLNYLNNTNAYNRNVKARIDTNLHGSKSNIRIPGNHHTATSSSFYGSTTRLNSVTGPYRPLTNNGMHYASNALSNHKSSSISQPGSRSNSPTGGRRLYNMYGSIHVQNSAAHNNPTHQSGGANYQSHQKFATVGRKAGVGLRQTPSATNVNTYYNSLKSRKNGMESVQPNMINANNYGNNHNNNNQLLGFEDENDIESIHSSSNNSFAYTSSSEKSFPLNSANKINNFNYNNHPNLKTNNTPNKFGQNQNSINNNTNSKFTLHSCTPPFQRGTSPYSSPFSPFVGSPSTMLHNSGPTTDLDSSDIITLLSSANWADRKEGLIHILRYFRSGNRLKPKEIKPVMENFSKMFMDPHSKVFSIFLDALIEFINFHADSLNDWLYILLTKLFTKMGQDLLTSIQTKCQKLLEVIRNSFPPSLQFDYLAKFLTDQTMTPNYKVKIGALHYCTTVVSSISQSDFNLYNESHIKLVDKVITMCNEPKSGEIRKLATFLLIALWECNPATFTMILQKLSKHQHDLAMALVHQYFPPNTDDATYDSNTSLLLSTTDNDDLKYNNNGSYLEKNGGNNFQHNIEVAFNDNGHQNNSLTNNHHPSRDGQILTPNNFTNLSFNPSSNNINTNQTISTNDISVSGGCSDSRKSYVYTPHVKKLILPSHFVASPANNVANMSKICLSNNTPIAANCSINLDKNISSYTHKNINNNNNNSFDNNHIHKQQPENVVMPIKMNNNDSFDSSMTMKPNIPPKPKLGQYNNSRDTPSPNYMVQDEYVQISKIPALKKGMSPFNNGSQPHNDSFQSNMSIDSQHSITNTNSHATKMLVIMNGNCNNANLQQGVKHNQSPQNSFKSRDPFDMSMISHQLEDVVNGKDHDFQQTLDKKMRLLQDSNAERSDVIQGLAYIKCLANSIQDKMVWEDVFINVLPTLYNLLRSSKPDDQIKCNTLATLKELVKQNGHFFSSVIFETLDALLAEHVCCPDKSSKEVIRMTEDVGTQLVKVLNPDITIPHILSFINGKYNLCAHESLQNAIKLLNQIIITHSEDDLHMYVQKCVSALIVNCDHAESCVRKCAVFCLVSLYVKYGDRVLPLFEPLAPQKRKILQVYIKRVNDQRTGGGALNETSHNITLLGNNSNTGTKNSPSHTQTAPFV